jgi:hypothetical protein
MFYELVPYSIIAIDRLTSLNVVPARFSACSKNSAFYHPGQATAGVRDQQ